MKSFLNNRRGNIHRKKFIDGKTYEKIIIRLNIKRQREVKEKAEL